MTSDFTFVYCCTCEGSKPVNMTRGVDSGGSFLLGDWISSTLHTRDCTFIHNIIIKWSSAKLMFGPTLQFHVDNQRNLYPDLLY